MAPTVRTVRILWAWKCKTKRQHVLIHYWLRVWCSYGSGAHLIANAGCTCACGASQFETSGKESTSQDNSKSWLQLGVRTQLHDRQMSGFWIACNTTWWTFGFWQLYGKYSQWSHFVLFRWNQPPLYISAWHGGQSISRSGLRVTRSCSTFLRSALLAKPKPFFRSYRTYLSNLLTRRLGSQEDAKTLPWPKVVHARLTCF